MYEHNGIKVFAEYIDSKTLDQFCQFLDGRKDIVKTALMPDAHFGYSVPIGSVFASDGYIYPAAVGYDIGCGMCAIRTSFSYDDVKSHAEDIAQQIYRDIPVGFNNNKVVDSMISNWSGRDMERSQTMNDIFIDGVKQIGTLGGGNHFIEVGYSTNDNSVWIIIHSGSRGVGHKLATNYMKLASECDQAKEGAFGFSEESYLGMNYITDMNFCLEFALLNRRAMLRRVIAAISKYCDGKEDGVLINRNHNHAEKKDGLWIHRKGATHAEAGMLGVIPGNMRDGSFIVLGKGNEDSLYSSSHGAGRVLGRNQAKKTLKIEDFASTMEGVVAKVTEGTLDESPFAYKDIFDVMRLQEGLVDVVAHIKPILNIKG